MASDHCAFNVAQKAVGKDDFRRIPAGVNGVAERLAVVWDRAVVSAALSTRACIPVTVGYTTSLFSVGIDLTELVGGQMSKCLKFCPGIEI